MENNRYYTTSDGTPFYTENDAQNHARTLEDKTVTPPSQTVANMEVVGASTVTGTNKQKPEGDQLKTKGPKLDEPFTLAAFNADAENAYEAGKALVKQLGLKPKTNKKADVFAAVATAKKAEAKQTPPAEPAKVDETTGEATEETKQ